ncbi:GNAT family N-acetyltransferase [Candidatus Enterococcus ferrettii]|uniref:N-acetyltransferase domain-containing protein n=1 Tax=Candidatus Enterococcus ferrettii TaxID=2815324 RepID=A0ABV0EU31_9ENTE|nr:GNAT family N-acetyltransferase [Enterococcus sp. 665A]MBO1339545.1 GNAT family N-acetyltransferase [Enterococcus sp. 665A]
MIKELTPTHSEIDELAQIWLASNLSAHAFIPAEYWQKNYTDVKELLTDARLFAYYREDKIVGFLGLMEQYIAGIFVRDAYQHQGIGKALMAEVKKQQTKLSLSVYAKNEQALHFYQKQNFVCTGSQVEQDTNELEYQMVWQD